MAYVSLGQRRRRFGVIRKILKPIYRPIVAAVKPILKPLVAMIPGVGPAAAIAFTAVRSIRQDAKARQQVIEAVQQAPSWGTMTDAERQAIINAITAGVVPSIKAPPDVAAAYQGAVQQQASAHPEWGKPTPGLPGAPEFAPPEAAADGPGMGTMLGIGAAAVVGMMLLGGGRRG